MIFNKKSQPAPGCLAIEKGKANGTYNCAEVVQRIRIDFKNKCYLCEDKEPHSINIEHFQPHRGDNDLKFEWNNLFYCCHHCNNTKLAIPKYDLILNCTVEEDAVETKLKYHINPWPKEKVQITSLVAEVKVQNTADLLIDVYNGTTIQKNIESANIRSKLLKEIRLFQDLLFKYYDDTYSDEENREIKENIIRLLRPTSGFTAFKKWVLRDGELSEEFAEYL